MRIFFYPFHFDRTIDIISVLNTMRKKSSFIFILIFCWLNAGAQNNKASIAHSHNDYEQENPFYSAYNKMFGSVEADIHLVNNELLVGHDAKNLMKERTLESLYLKPIIGSNQINRSLQLLIDIKTEAISTINALIKILSKYPGIIQNKNIKIVLSGNLPSPEQFTNYPDFIWFDGRVSNNYSSQELTKIALISEDFNKIIGPKRSWPPDTSVVTQIKTIITKVHDWGKPVRFWGNPDHPNGWELFLKWGVDYINTDKINELADYLKSRTQD